MLEKVLYIVTPALNQLYNGLQSKKNDLGASVFHIFVSVSGKILIPFPPPSSASVRLHQEVVSLVAQSEC